MQNRKKLVEINKEIELKFAIENLPELNNENIEIFKIVQDYIYKDEFSTIRKRIMKNIINGECKYIYTVKTDGDIKDKHSVYEIETEITEEKYNLIKSSNNIVEKYRIKIQIGNELVAELDIYYGHLEGLITVEVEFENEEDLSKFEKPIWFGKELYKKQFSNAKLSRMTRDEFLNIVDKETIDKNMKFKQIVEEFIKSKNKGANQDEI